MGVAVYVNLQNQSPSDQSAQTYILHVDISGKLARASYLNLFFQVLLNTPPDGK